MGLGMVTKHELLLSAVHMFVRISEYMVAVTWGARVWFGESEILQLLLEVAQELEEQQEDNIKIYC